MNALVQQDAVPLRWGHVGEPGRVERIKDSRFLKRSQCPRLGCGISAGPWRGQQRRGAAVMPGMRCPGTASGRASITGTYPGCEQRNGMIDHFSVSRMLLLVESCPNRAESFPRIEITCLAVSNSRSSRAFPIWSPAASLTDRLAGRSPDGRARAARAPVVAWWRGPARRSRARCRELRGEAGHRRPTDRGCRTRQGCHFYI